MMGTVSGPTEAGLEAGNGVGMGATGAREETAFWTVGGDRGGSQRAHRAPWGSLPLAGWVLRQQTLLEREMQSVASGARRAG